MKNEALWSPSKFVYQKGKLSASRDTKDLSITSRLSAGIVAGFYDEHLKLHTRGKLLDLGCGKVPLYEAYKQFVTETTCVDWANSLHPNKFIDFECDLNYRLPFQENLFDTIILSDVLEHIRYPESLWKEMHRVLNRNGKVLLNVPFFYWLHEEPFDYFRYTKFALQSMAMNAGFRIILLEPLGGVPEILGDLVAKNLQRVSFGGRLAARLVQAAASCFIRTKIGARISKTTSDQFPFGYFMVVCKPE